MGGKIKKWVRDELEKGTDPELLKSSLKAQGLDPGLVDELTGSGKTPIQRVPWRKGVPVLLILIIAVLAYNWMKSPEGIHEVDLDSRFNLTATRGSTESVSLSIGFVQGVEKSLQEYGTWKISSELPDDQCYSVYKDRDSEGSYVGIKKIDSWQGNCIGEALTDTKIRIQNSVNIETDGGGTCVCGSQALTVESSAIRNRDTGETILNLKITRQ